MRTTYVAGARGGHCPGHVRDTFLAAIEAFCRWRDGEPEPTVEFEVHSESRSIPILEACGMVWNCSDTLPRGEIDNLEDCGVRPLRNRTYASAARAMKEWILLRRIAASAIFEGRSKALSLAARIKLLASMRGRVRVIG
jgi:hypothetical protein